jgi:hypothetical protein
LVHSTVNTLNPRVTVVAFVPSVRNYLLSMPVVAFTFGSFRDVLVTAGLVTNICQALYDPSDISLTHDLQSVHKLLLLTHDIVQHQGSMLLAKALANTLDQTITQCHLEMRLFLNKIDDIWKPISWTSVGTLCDKVWRASWQPDDVMKLRARLSTHQQRLTFLLEVLNKSVSTYHLLSSQSAEYCVSLHPVVRCGNMLMGFVHCRRLSVALAVTFKHPW